MKHFLFQALNTHTAFSDTNRGKILWLIRLRWVALVLQSCILPMAVIFEWLETRFIPLYLLTLLNIFLLNISSIFLFKKANSFSNGLVFFHLLVDLFAFVFLLLLTGGIWNPFLSLIFFHAALGAILLEGRMRLYFCFLLLASLFILHFNPNIPPAILDGPRTNRILMPTNIFVTFAIFLVITWLSHALIINQKFLQRLQDQKNRVDNLRALGALSAGFSHEFATPLNTIKLRVDRLLRKNNLEQNDDIQAIKKALEQCEQTLTSMVGSGLHRENITFTNVLLSPLIQQICAQWSTKERQAAFVQGEGLAALVCHIPMLPFAKALLDLLDNAEQASRSLASSEKIDISVSLERRGELLIISVIDRGPGWPDIVKKLAGEPFVTTKSSGTGLGLYNATTLAAAVGGHFSLLETPGGGATAQFSIPIAVEETSFAGT